MFQAKLRSSNPRDAKLTQGQHRTTLRHDSFTFNESWEVGNYKAIKRNIARS